MPFITEELWHLIATREKNQSISTSDYPEVDEKLINKKADNEMEFVQNIITAIRNIRGEKNIPPSKTINVFIKSSEVAPHQVEYIKKLAKVDNLMVDMNLEKPKGSISAVLKDCEIFVPLEGLIDINKEKERIQKEITRFENSLVGIGKKLSNEKFLQNAAPEIVERERTKQKEWQENIKKLKEILTDLG